eukprot:gene6114-2718_t
MSRAIVPTLHMVSRKLDQLLDLSPASEQLLPSFQNTRAPSSEQLLPSFQNTRAPSSEQLPPRIYKAVNPTGFWQAVPTVLV